MDTSLICRLGRIAVASAVTMGVVTATGGALAAAAPTVSVLPDWYTSNKVTVDTWGCEAPIVVDNSRVQLTCHTNLLQPVHITTPGVGEWGNILQADVAVPGGEAAVEVSTFNDDDAVHFIPLESDRVVTGRSSMFWFNRHRKHRFGSDVGTTMVVHSPAVTGADAFSDFTVTIHSALH